MQRQKTQQHKFICVLDLEIIFSSLPLINSQHKEPTSGTMSQWNTHVTVVRAAVKPHLNEGVKIMLLKSTMIV